MSDSCSDHTIDRPRACKWQVCTDVGSMVTYHVARDDNVMALCLGVPIFAAGEGFAAACPFDVPSHEIPFCRFQVNIRICCMLCLFLQLNDVRIGKSNPSKTCEKVKLYNIAYTDDFKQKLDTRVQKAQDAYARAQELLYRNKVDIVDQAQSLIGNLASVKKTLTRTMKLQDLESSAIGEQKIQQTFS